MTAVAASPTFATLNRPGWGSGEKTIKSGHEDVRGMNTFMPRKIIQRTSSSSSIGSSSSASSTSTAISNGQPNGSSMPPAGETGAWPQVTPRKRYQIRGQALTEVPGRAPAARPPVAHGANGANGTAPLPPASPHLAQQGPTMSQNGSPRPNLEALFTGRQPTLHLLSLNGSFERKSILVPFAPDVLRIGRQTNAKTVPTAINGYFDSKVLSRQHAEIWADSNGKIWIRDIKSSNGTFVNGTRLSQENRESEPHEIQTADHLELGIDIVSEDQKEIVHHKVAAKVEYAGFMGPSNNLMDMNFGDLDPSNSNAMATPMVTMPPLRAKSGSQASLASNGRMVPGAVMPAQNGPMLPRQFWSSAPTTEHIVRKIQNEMRNAKVQNHDLLRTSAFLNALLSKEDIKNGANTEGLDQLKNHAMTGSNSSLRADNNMARFSNPPAPPPSQPLPEKPDTPSLKRGPTERPKISNTPPIRQDNGNLGQILQLTDALNNAKKEIDSHGARVRALEAALLHERAGRIFAEDILRRMDESQRPRTNGTALPPLLNAYSELDKAFDFSLERPPTPDRGKASEEEKMDSAAQTGHGRATDDLKKQLDSAMQEMRSLKDQVQVFRQRAEKAETERDADRSTLADMVLQIRRQGDEENAACSGKFRCSPKPRSLSKRRSRSTGPEQDAKEPVTGHDTTAESTVLSERNGHVMEKSTLLQVNNSMPASRSINTWTFHPPLVESLPYASMLGVVLIGMGMMAYLNSWQPQPTRLGH